MKNQKKTKIPPTNWETVDDIIAVLKEGRSFCLSGHQNPDGDVIGSELALAGLIKRFSPKKKVFIQNSGPVPKSVSFLPGAGSIQNVTRVDDVFDVVILFECSGSDRMGGIF